MAVRREELALPALLLRALLLLRWLLLRWLLLRGLLLRGLLLRGLLLRGLLLRGLLLRGLLPRALLRELAARLLPLLDPVVFWVLVRPRDAAPRLPLPDDLFAEPRLLERLEEPRPLVADIVHLLLFDSHD